MAWFLKQQEIQIIKMKKVIVIVALLFTASVYAAVFPGIAESIAAAIKLGNSKELAKYFAPTVELVIGEKSGTYSKAQAEMMVKDFFAKNPVKDYKVMHQGNSQDNSLYTIGDLTSNKSYRTYYLLRKSGDSYLIHQLRFEDKDE